MVCQCHCDAFPRNRKKITCMRAYTVLNGVRKVFAHHPSTGVWCTCYGHVYFLACCACLLLGAYFCHTVGSLWKACLLVTVGSVSVINQMCWSLLFQNVFSYVFGPTRRASRIVSIGVWSEVFLHMRINPFVSVLRYLTINAFLERRRSVLGTLHEGVR